MADRYTVLEGDQILDATITEDDLNASVAGDGLSGGAGTPLALDLDELTGAVVDVANDSIAIVDADDNSSKKESIADLVSAIAGTGLTATNGVLSADGVTDNLVEGDVVKEDQDTITGAINDANTDYELTSIPVTASLDIYLNGQYQAEGSGKDYELNPDSGNTKTIRFVIAPATGSKITARYFIDNA